MLKEKKIKNVIQSFLSPSENLNLVHEDENDKG